MSGDRAALVSFWVGSVLAGGNAVAVRFSNRELAPLWGAGLRFGLAAAILLLMMLAMRLPLPRGRALLGSVIYGALGFAGAFALAYYSLIRLQAGLGQTIVALVPLATLLVAVAARQERFRAAAALGSVIALSGVGLISGASPAGSIPLLSLLASLGAVLCFAVAGVVVRGLPPVHPVTMNAVAMAAGAALLLLGSVLAGEQFALPQRFATWMALAYVVPVGSVVVFILYLVLLKYWEASRAAYSFVVIPFVTVLLSAWLDDERLSWTLIVGGLLIIAGVYVGALREREPDTSSR